jgi:hypothetical protein
MKLKQAIKILEEQKQKILSSDHTNNRQLIIETGSYVKDFFGLSSAEFNFVNRFDFNIDFNPKVSEKNRKIVLENKANDFVLFLDNCKRTLENKGLFKEPKNNLLSDKSNAALIGTIFTISTIVFGIGFYFGTEKINNELIRTENEFTKLKDSLSSTKTFDSTNGMTNDEEKIAKPENNDD